MKDIKPAEKLLQSVVEIFGKSKLSTIDSIEFALRVMAWAKLSRQGTVPDSLDFSTYQVQSIQGIEDAFRKLADLEALGKYREIFIGARELGAHHLFPIQSVFSMIQDADKNGILENFQLSLYPFLSFERKASEYSLPEEVASLMLGLAGDVSGKSIYCPYDEIYTFSDLLRKANAEVYVENSNTFPAFLALRLINNLDVKVEVGDPLLKPNYIISGELQQFDLALSFLPVGYKASKSIQKKDLFSRFSESTSSGNVLNIRHILSHTSGKAIVACTQSVLFSTGAERSLREDLLTSGMVEAVIVLPSALLPYSSVPLSILILDKGHKHKTVRFFDGDDPRFFERGFRGRSVLSNWELLLEQFQCSTDEAMAIDIPVEDILAKNSDLTPSRYLLTPELKAVNRILDKSECQVLEDCVQIIRPLPSSKLQRDHDEKTDAYISVHEFEVADFPDFGFLTKASKQVNIFEKELLERDFESFLQPLDILIAARGSVGQVAITPENTPPGGNGGWFVNQSCLILRSPQGLDPRALFMYLRSDVGQCLLNSLVVGATVSMIQLKTLRALKVIMPTEQESDGLIAAFEEQVQRQTEIEALKRLQVATDKRYWSIS